MTPSRRRRAAEQDGGQAEVTLQAGDALVQRGLSRRVGAHGVGLEERGRHVSVAAE